MKNDVDKDKKKVKTTNRIKKTQVKKKIKEEDKKPVKKDLESENDVEKLNSNSKVIKEKNEASLFNIFEVLAIIVITAVLGIFIGTLISYFKDSVEEYREEEKNEAFSEFLEVYDELSSDYYKDIDKKKLIESGIKGMIDYLDDPHSSYLDINASDSLNEELEGEFVGMGATVSVNESGDIYIVSIMNNGPASRAGFEVGDIIKKVGEAETTGKTTTEVAKLIKGDFGTKVDLVIIRNNEEKKITLTRGKVELESVSGTLFEDSGVGYVHISLFAKNTPKQFKSEVDSLIEQGANSLVIDVRNNTGGYLYVAEEILEMFLEKGSIGYQLRTKDHVDVFKTSQDKIYNLPIVVIMNGGSASASEVFAAGLKENLNITLVGEKSYGKGTVQKTVKLDSGAMIKYTTQEWLTPKGNSVDKTGLAPDFEVKLDEKYFASPSYQNDNQIQKAIEVLKKR